jgi:hypothetical protein
LVEREAAILLVLFFVQQVFEVGIADLYLALGIRTENRQLSFLNLSPKVLTEAILVEHMLAKLQGED